MFLAGKAGQETESRQPVEDFSILTTAINILQRAHCQPI